MACEMPQKSSCPLLRPSSSAQSFWNLCATPGGRQGGVPTPSWSFGLQKWNDKKWSKERESEPGNGMLLWRLGGRGGGKETTSKPQARSGQLENLPFQFGLGHVVSKTSLSLEPSMKAFLVSNTLALSDPVLLRKCITVDSPLVDQIHIWLRELIEPKPNKWRNAFLELAREGCPPTRQLTALEVDYILSGVFARLPAIAFYNVPPKDNNWYGFHDRNAHPEAANTLFLHASFASGYDRLLKMNPVQMLRNLPILLEVVKAKVYRLAAHWFVYKVWSRALQTDSANRSCSTSS
jgi:hypothetical protein